MWFFMSALGYHFLLRQSKFKSYQAKKEGEPEELTHLTEGSFEDTTIVVSFSNNLNPETKRRAFISSPSMFFINFSCKVSV